MAVDPGAGIVHPIEGRGHDRAIGAKPRPLVEDQQVLGRIEQLLVLVLAVQFDQAVGQVLQGAGGGQGPVDEGPTAALRGDLAPDDDLEPGESGRKKKRYYN